MSAAGRIHVSGGKGKDTHIKVQEWPNPRAAWRVGTTDDRGRYLEVVGYHRFTEGAAVGSMQLHFDGRKPLTIVSYNVADTLVRLERPVPLGAMLLCAQRIAVELQERLGMGNGCLEWQLDHKRIDAVHTLFPDFERVNKPLKQLHRRGMRYLRKCP